MYLHRKYCCYCLNLSPGHADMKSDKGEEMRAIWRGEKEQKEIGRERAKGGRRERAEDSKREEGHKGRQKEENGNREGSDPSAFHDFGSHS